MAKTPTFKAAAKHKHSSVEPINPFTTVVKGISLLFANALSVGIFFAIVGIFASGGNIFPTPVDGSNNPFNDVIRHIQSLSPSDLLFYGLLFIIILLVAFVVSAMLHGMQSYTIFKLSKNEQVTLGEAFSSVLEKFGGYLALYLWMNIKIFLWSLLLIIPGIIAGYRYSFAGVLFFDKDLHGEKAIKESIRLTKKGLLTIFASQMLFNVITFSLISTLVSISSLSILYKVFVSLDNDGEEKPAAHWLVWLALALPFILIFLIVMLLIVVLIVAFSSGGFSSNTF